MSASPPPTGEYPAPDSRKRKRARGEEDDHAPEEEDQVNGNNGLERGFSSGSGISGQTAPQAGDAQSSTYTSPYGRSQLGESSRAPYPSPGPTVTQSSSSAGQQPTSSEYQQHRYAASASNGHAAPRDQQTDARNQPQPHASRAARFDRQDRILTKDTLEPSYFVVEPNDEFTREVGDWLWGWIKNRADVEVSSGLLDLPVTRLRWL